jgi:protein SCO1/2
MKSIWAVVIISVISITIGYFILKPTDKKELPVLNPIDIDSDLADDEIERIGYGHTVQNFSFTDQNNKPFGSKELKGKIYVAEYFFTTCGTICPIMNQQMQRVQQKFKNNKEVQIVSVTVDPEHDSIPQLLAYAKAHGADNSQWHFLTGKKEDLYKLARKSLFLLKPAEVRNQGDVGNDFIHTNFFVLVDKHAQIRGFYDGTSEKAIGTLMEDIDLLLEEK